MRNTLYILLLVLGLVPAYALAQAVPDPVQYVVAPETPLPNQTVEIEVQGVGGFVGDANITWRQNGTVASQGIGQSTYTFAVGPLGTRTVIDVTVDSATQGTIVHEFVFNPSQVNLLWEAQTTVPPFYRGKAMYSAGSTLRVVAYPIVFEGSSRVPSNQLSYHWSEGDTPLTASSGTGRSTLVLAGDELQAQEDISVDVYDGTLKVARGEISIPAQNPAVYIYESDALRGVVYDRTIPANIALNAKEITVKAEPFYFDSASARGGALSYDWQLNSEPISGPDAQRGILTLRQSGAGAGQAQLSVAIQNTRSNQFVQNASAALTILFGQTNGLSSFFGI
ncbi:MAG: hypothetical protein KGI70_01350 [Patescibacteria group bacterium]|nr:hypothetical protein [Patescibacteria group bacterium]